MQRQRAMNRPALARWIASLIMLVVVAVFGRGYGPNPGAPSARGPLPDQISGAGRPIDGDSLHVGQNEVRLKGIDAPEGRQTCLRNGSVWACGEDSRRELVRLIGHDVVKCSVLERDRFSRFLSRCTAGGRDLNAGMVAAGLAVAYGGYVREEGEAKIRKRGLWGSDFQRPREWRDEHHAGG